MVIKFVLVNASANTLLRRGEILDLPQPPLRRRMFARFTTIQMVFISNTTEKRGVWVEHHYTQTTQFLVEFAFNSEVLKYWIWFESNFIRFT